MGRTPASPRQSSNDSALSSAQTQLVDSKTLTADRNRKLFLLDSAAKAVHAAIRDYEQDDHVDVHLASAEYFLQLADEFPSN